MIHLPGLTMKNPLMPASGTFGYGQGYTKQYDLNQLGALVTKSTTLAPKTGNSGTIYADGPASTLNAVGLTNPGMQAVIDDKLPWLATHYPELPIIVSIAGESVAEYQQLAQTISQQPHVAAIEVNISCPNVERGGMSFGIDPEQAERVTRAVKRVSKVPIYVKLSPNVTSLVTIAQAVIAGGADGLSMINTLMAMRFDLKTGEPILNHVTGGLSGPAILPIALNAVYQVRQMTDLPIIGMGGVNSGQDAYEMMLAGADAVAVGSANYYRERAIPAIAEELALQQRKVS